MNSKVFSQLDTRWSKLLYPSKPYNIGSSGCGCCSVTHVIIESKRYKSYTPKNVQPYMKQFAVPAQGTRWAGITASLEHYGFKAINHATMNAAFETLDGRKKRLGILLFRGGTKGGVTWTTSGHYVAFTGYKIKDGKHYFYCKDSGGRRHTGWYCYETQMKGLVVQVWTAAEKIQHSNAWKLRKSAKAVTKYMADHKFKYEGSWKDNALSWSKAKKKRTTNCSTQVCYDLQRIGLLEPDEYFWINGDSIVCQGGLTMDKLKKLFIIDHPHKSPKKLGADLHKGDICGYGDKKKGVNPHTQIFSNWTKKGNPTWYSTGSNDDIRKGKAHVKKSYNKKLIYTRMRLR